MIFENNQGKKDLYRIIKIIANSNVVLYGAGKYGRQALNNIKKYFPNLAVRYFIDDNRIRNNGSIDGIEIVSLEYATQNLGKDFYIIITNYYISQVLKKIENAKIDLSKVFFCNELLIDTVNIDYIRKNKDHLVTVYNLLSDYKSKMIYRVMIEARFTGIIDLLCHTCDSEQYFPDFFELDKNEIFVDAGAFDGDTIEQFINKTDRNFKYIYAFEPDPGNYTRLKDRAYPENVKLFCAGLYDITGKLRFSANKGGSSKIEDCGAETVQVYQFDGLNLPEKKITFVKMDIEGSELKALEGMQHIIQEHKPKLAICIYHKFEDIWELPIYIKKLVPEYKFYIRNYTTYLDEVVLYATL